MITRLDIELYTEGRNYCAYIGEAGSSGYECVGPTPEECAEQVKQYVINDFILEENEANRK
jgi:hypothetical protein